jgi:hypothetical protein
MPRGSKPGERRGGRKKGTPNKATSEAREAFQLVYERQLPNLERWLVETGDGYEKRVRAKRGQPARTVTVEPNPGKAADILTRMAEHFVPKLQRQEKTIVDATDEELLQEVRRRRAAAEGIPPTSGQPEQPPKP